MRQSVSPGRTVQDASSSGRTDGPGEADEMGLTAMTRTSLSARPRRTRAASGPCRSPRDGPPPVSTPGDGRPELRTDEGPRDRIRPRSPGCRGRAPAKTSAQVLVDELGHLEHRDLLLA